MEGIATDGPVAYGPGEVATALKGGAVETLLVADETLRRGREAGKEDIDGIMEAARSTGGEVVVLSVEFEPGRRLERLGGVAALLRYRIT
jgi:protein pelota